MAARKALPRCHAGTDGPRPIRAPQGKGQGPKDHVICGRQDNARGCSSGMQPASSKKIKATLRQIVTRRRRLRLHLPSSVLTSDASLCLFHTRLSGSTNTYVPIRTSDHTYLWRTTRLVVPSHSTAPSLAPCPCLASDASPFWERMAFWRAPADTSPSERQIIRWRTTGLVVPSHGTAPSLAPYPCLAGGASPLWEGMGWPRRC
jgi:hypothetical protein